MSRARPNLVARGFHPPAAHTTHRADPQWAVQQVGPDDELFDVKPNIPGPCTITGLIVPDHPDVCAGGRLHILHIGASYALWLSAPAPETYTAQATAIPAVQSNKVHIAPWSAVPSIPVRAGA